LLFTLIFSGARTEIKIPAVHAGENNFNKLYAAPPLHMQPYSPCLLLRKHPMLTYLLTFLKRELGSKILENINKERESIKILQEGAQDLLICIKQMLLFSY